MIPPKARVFLVFVAALAVYLAWGTGGTFRYAEIPVAPSYNLLAQSMAQGRLDLAGPPYLQESVKVHQGRRYLLPGPLPAVLRLPFALVAANIPTGLAIALFCAGTVALAFASMVRLSGNKGGNGALALALIFSGALGLSGYALFLNALPLASHEAVAGASFFLMAATALYLRFSARAFAASWVGALGFALCLGAACACRWAFFPAAGALGVAFLWGMTSRKASRAGPNALILVVAGVLTVGSLLAYNHARFGNAWDFGAPVEGQPLTEYAEVYGPYRYDQIPVNLWNLFFRMPRAGTAFPYIHMPLFTLAGESAGPQSYYLANVNELCASLFVLFPLALLAAVPLGSLVAGRAGKSKGDLTILALSAALVVLSLAGGLRSVARSYWEFLPLMTVLAFWGASWLKDRGKMTPEAAGVLAGVSVAVSFSLAAQGVLIYYAFYHFRGPLLGWFF
ncbi:MAG: hypothetical protein KKA60_06435 [Proteobacteria bacterium]|nr:hypothetical protein [Pseudomonadota bacterium]